MFDQDSLLSFSAAITVFSDAADDILESWAGSSMRGSGGATGRWVGFPGEGSLGSLVMELGEDGDMLQTCKERVISVTSSWENCLFMHFLELCN